MESILYAITAGIGLGWIAIPHCCGMCGPLHLAICSINRQKVIATGLNFNIGKLIGYTIAGALLGWLGSFFTIPFKSSCPHCGGDKPGYLIFLFPAVILFISSITTFLKVNKSLIIPSYFNRIFNKLKDKNTVVLGSLTSLIPCGMLYIAFAAAISLGSPLEAALLMFTFSFTIALFLQIGTILGRFIDKKYALLFEKFFPWLTLIGGCIYLGFFLHSLKVF